MLTFQALFALTYVFSVPLIAFSIVAGINKNFRAKQLYGFFGIISFIIAVITYIFFILELLSY